MRRVGVVARNLGDECLLYDEDGGAIHVLNPIAEFVWNLCDGTRTEADLEAAVREGYEVPEGSDVSGDIASILDEFEQLSVLADKG